MTEDQYQAAAIPHEIIIEGHLSKSWIEWFEGLTFQHTCDGRTILTGEILDQAALHGLLKEIRDLGLTLLSINRVPADEDQLDASDTEIQMEEVAGQGDTAVKASESSTDPEADEQADNLQPLVDH